jgi:hypothetical protein
MPRIRTIKPEAFRSPTMRRLSIPARYVLLGLLTEADDEGRFVASSKALAGALFPHDDDVTGARFEKWFHEIVSQPDPTVVVYSVDGVRYGYFPKWWEHQKISHPTLSRLPIPPGITPENLPKDSALNREKEREQGTGNREALSRFEEFWAAYPKEGRRDKPKAREAFVKACGKATPDEIIAGARSYAADPNRKPDKTKYAQGWLTGERWTEEPLPGAQPHDAAEVPTNRRAALGRGLLPRERPRLR